MYRFFLLFTALIIVSVPHAMAYTEYPDNYTFEETEFEEEMIGTEITDDYIFPSYEVLSRIYWAMGDLDYSNDNDIDGYLKINECSIYNKYRNDEFEWAKIRDLTRSNIQENVQDFTTTIDIVRPIELGEYNMKEEYFDLALGENLRRTRLIDLRDSHNLTVCGDFMPIEGYPKIMRIMLTRPLEIERIDVKKQLARYFLDEVSERFKGISEQYYINNYKRIAYARLKVRVMKSFGIIYDINVGPMPIMYVMATLDGVEVYVDKELTKPIYIEDFIGKRKLSKRRRRGPKPNEEVEENKNDHRSFQDVQQELKAEAQ